MVNDADPAMELIAKIIDINPGSGEAALKRSTTLQGYSFLIEEVRKNQHNGMTRDKAIVAGIDTCIASDVLTVFLTEHYLEVSKMLNWEYDAEAEKRVLTEEAVQQGMQQGMQQGVLQGAEMVAKLLKEGFSLEDALEKIKSESSEALPS